ncbi:MAG: ROK family protein [Tannerellaceae bacterium]|nr:ROK family protein [Tannerellaceae bacterium]
MNYSKFYLGLDVGGTNLVAGVVDEAYRVIAKESMPANAGRSIEEITADMAEVSKRALEKAGLTLNDVSSWGIGMPSCVNPKTNLLVHSNNFGWKNVPVYDYLKKHIQLPTYIANDANCAAYGEALAGAAKDYTDVVMLTLGTGVGGGIILNKKIYSGYDTMGAELGHTKLVYNGVPCTCGQKGCLESYASSTALIRRARELMPAYPDSILWNYCEQPIRNINGEMIFRASEKGDPLAMQLIDEYIGYLSAGISSFITIFRPQIIIVGGGIAEAGDDLLKPLNERLFVNTFAAEEIGIPTVVKAQLGNEAGLIGAALLEKTM